MESKHKENLDRWIDEHKMDPTSEEGRLAFEMAILSIAAGTIYAYYEARKSKKEDKEFSDFVTEILKKKKELSPNKDSFFSQIILLLLWR